MSETIDTIQKKRRVASARGREFLNSHVLKRSPSQGTAPKLPPLPNLKDAYDLAVAQAKPVIDAAETLLAVNPALVELAAVRVTYDAASQANALDVKLADYTKASSSLAKKEAAARNVSAAKATAEANYRNAAAAAKPMTDAAEKLLSVQPLQQPITAQAPAYRTAAAAVATAVQASSFGAALQLLPAKENAAKAIMMEKGRLDAAALKKKQVEAQIAHYDDMAPAFADVKRTYLSAGGAKRIEDEKLAPGKHFQDFLTALKTLETAKQGVNPSQPVAPNLAATIKGNCDTVVAKAQAYLIHYNNDLSKNQQTSKDSLAKKRHCETTLITARQYGMAMDFDAAGKPTANAPWDAQTDMRMSGLNAAFSYEQGYFKASGLGDSGDAAGKSDSYWIKGATISETSGIPKKNKQGDFLFKPMDGEAPMDGGTDVPGAGAAKEAIAFGNAKLFAAQTGIDLGVPETNVVAIGQHALTGGDPSKPPLIGSVQSHAGASTQIADLPMDIYKKIKRGEAHKIALMDIVSLSVDRHGGNIMVDPSDPENPRLIPIDHGGTLPDREAFKTLKSRFGGISESMMGGVQVINETLNIPAAYESFDPEMQAKIALLDPNAMEQGMKDQRDTLDAVQPGLGAKTKVSDESLHMSKRSMMFLKLAAKTLSPAEIQIAIAAHGDELFDATDQAFDQVANVIIAEAAPKRDAYMEFLSSPSEEQTAIVKWLDKNGWKYADANGRSTASNLVMHDPINALKLYKSQTANTAPVAGGFDAFPRIKATPAPALPDQATIDLITATFPRLPPVDPSDYDKNWKERLDLWNRIGAKGGMNAYQAVLTATGAAAQTRMSDTLQTLNYWEEINKAENAAALALLPTLQGPADPTDVLTAALIKVATDDLKLKQNDQVQTVGATVDANTALATNTARLLTEARNVIGQIIDQGKAGTLGGLADAAEAKAQQGDATGAEADIRAIYKDALEVAFLEVKGLVLGVRDQIDALNMTPNQEADYAQYRPNADGAPSFELMSEVYDQFQKLYAGYLANGAKQDPNAGALPAFTWSQADASATKKKAVQSELFKDQDTGMTAALKAVNTARTSADTMKSDLSVPKKSELIRAALGACRTFDAFIDEKLVVLSTDSRWKDYCASASTIVAQEVARYSDLLTNLDTGAGLPQFSWLDSDASAVKKQAVRAGMFKDKDTGMTAALKAANAARTPVTNMSAALPNASKRQILQKGVTELTKFLDFVNKKLRILSRDPNWAEYCASAVETVQGEIDTLKAQILTIP